MLVHLSQRNISQGNKVKSSRKLHDQMSYIVCTS
jgi:hypothetical protein